MKYQILIEETLARVVEVEAETSDQAVEIIDYKYNRGEIVPNSGDLSDVLIRDIITA